MQRFALIFVSLFLACAVHAADPAPNADKKEKVENIQQSGALKVEEKPAVSPEALKGEPTPTPAQPPLEPASTPAASESQRQWPYFGFHAALGVPHPVTYGVDALHPSGYFSGGISVGSASMKADQVEISLDNSDLAFRWHPFAGSFYLGVMLGRQTLKAKKTELVSGQSVSAEVKIESNTMTPHLGWMWGLADGGFFVGIDFGMQNPSGVTTTLTTVPDGSFFGGNSDYQALVEDVQKKGNDIGNTALPYASILRIGYLF